MKKFALRLPDDLHSALQEHASDTERSLNGLIVYILRDFVECDCLPNKCYTREHYNGVTVASSVAALNDTEECRR